MRLTLLPGGVQTFDIKRQGSRVALGRKEGSDIIINEPVVSGTHCYITVVSRNEALIEDVSTNGTYVNGVRAGKGTRLSVHDGDMLTLGKPGTATGPIGTGVCVNFRVSFDGPDPTQTTHQGTHQAPRLSSPSNGSMAYKQEIEDMKVMVSQGEHRNDVLSAKNAEVSTKMIIMENELKKVREDNVELAVRNDSMKSEIESLRVRLSQADSRTDLAEKRTESLQAKVLMMEKDFTEISRLRAEFNISTSLREELERLRKRCTELSWQLNTSMEARRKISSNLESIQQLATQSLRLGDEYSTPGDASSVGTISSPNALQTLKKNRDLNRNLRGLTVAYPDHPVESANPNAGSPGGSPSRLSGATLKAIEDSPKQLAIATDLMN